MSRRSPGVFVDTKNQNERVISQGAAPRYKAPINLLLR
jgi:hypothetical protein